MRFRNLLVSLSFILVAGLTVPTAISQADPGTVSTETAHPGSIVGTAVSIASAETVSEKNVRDSCQIDSLEDIKSAAGTASDKDEILHHFGEPDEKLQSAMDNSELWRFDLCSDQSYDHVAGDDSVDLNGLSEDKVTHIVYFNFSDEGKVDSYSVYYKDSSGVIHEFVEFSNGYSKDNEIYGM